MGRRTVRILHRSTGEMSSHPCPPTVPTRQRQAWQDRLRGRFVVLATLALLLGASLVPTAVEASTAAPAIHRPAMMQPDPTPTTRTDAQIVFSVGTLSKVDQQTVTLAFDDGSTETYRLAADTTFQTQNGDAQALADFDLGATVVVIADETNLTALTIVNGGDDGFHEAGPADIRGHTNECGPCDEPPAMPGSPTPLR